MLNTAAQEAVIALGIYLIESGYKHLERWIPCVYIFKSENKITFSRILDYLLGLHRGLSSATFPDEFARDRTARSASGDSKEKKCVFFGEIPRYFCRIPPAETFAFSLTTLLNDVAAHKPEVVNSCVYLVFHLRCPFQVAERIFEGQVELMASVLAQLQELKRHEGPSPFNTRKSTCKCLVPVLLGTARAMGRFSGSEAGGQSSLLGKLYPRPGDHGPVAQAGPVKGFANFR